MKSNFREFVTKRQGITLIALIITIIILLILAGITISNINGENGLFKKTLISERRTDEASVLESAIIYENTNVESEPKETCIYPTQFDYIFTGEVKEYIENRLGRELTSSDTFYKIDTDKLNKKTDNLYIINKEKNLVIRISPEELATLQKGRSIWFWCNMNKDEESIYVKSHEKVVKTLDKLQQESITNIYIPIDRRMTDIYQDFITEASKRNMSVYALEGDPAFVFEEAHENCINGIIDNIVDYNSRVPEEARIKGVHYDVEPYGNTNNADPDRNWVDGQTEKAKNSNVRKLYMNFVKKSSEYAKEHNLIVEYDVSLAFNKFTYYNEQGEERTMSEDIIKYADKVTIMAYTTNANNIFGAMDKSKSPETAGDGSLVKAEKSWMQIANENQKAIEIGVDLETFKNEEETLKNHPEYAGVYIDPNYKYTYDYVNNTILAGVTEKMSNYDKENNSKTQYTYAIHYIYTFLNLINL